MEKITTSTKLFSTESINKNSTESTKKSTSPDKVGSIVELVDFHNPQFKPWYCSQVIRLGTQRFLEIAAIAKTGKDPQTLFSWLLKKAPD